MAKKTKKTETTTAKQAASKPVDPVKTQNLLRLLNTLALLLAIGAFLLQLFAVLTHYWKWQKTDLHQLLSFNNNRYTNTFDDSRIEQNYGLYSRDVKVYANNDEQVDAWTSTRFPRVDDGEENFAHCLSRSTSLRGALLTCSKRLSSPPECHCRRYYYWNWVIFFEVTALVLLGIVVFLVALLRTQFGPLLKLAAAGLSILAFIFLLVGLILILAHLKRETRSIADTYPHIYQRLANHIGTVPVRNRLHQRSADPLRSAIRRRAPEYYRAYSLSPGQNPYNETHFQEYSETARAWIYRPYSSLSGSAPYPITQKQYPDPDTVAPRRDSTVTPVYSRYGPAIGYDQVFDKTRAGIGRSTVLSILSTILSLLLPLILLFSWLTGKKVTPDTVKTVTTTTTKEYVAVPTTLPADYNPNRPIGEAVVTARNPQQSTPYDSGRADSTIIRDVIIRDDPAETQILQERIIPVNLESSQTGFRS